MNDVFDKEISEESVERKNTSYVKCSNCGSNMVFDPITQALKCNHCGTIDDFGKNKNVKELDILGSLKEAENWDKESSVYRCDNCGAVVVLNVHEVAKSCPYCGTSHIVKSEELAGLKPNAVYPFTVTQEDGAIKAKAWAKRKFFAPRKFKKNLLV